MQRMLPPHAKISRASTPTTVATRIRRREHLENFVVVCLVEGAGIGGKLVRNAMHAHPTCCRTN
jgi:hypothetical protein